MRDRRTLRGEFVFVRPVGVHEVRPLATYHVGHPLALDPELILDAGARGGALRHQGDLERRPLVGGLVPDIGVERCDTHPVAASHQSPAQIGHRDSGGADRQRSKGVIKQVGDHVRGARSQHRDVHLSPRARAAGSP